jgi:cytochrome b561
VTPHRGRAAYSEPLGKLTPAALRTGHLALYVLTIAMPISGHLMSSAGGNEVSWFGLFSLPRLLGKDKFLDEAASWAHLVFAWAIAIALTAHLWHAATKRDSVPARMWPRYRPASAT